MSFPNGQSNPAGAIPVYIGSAIPVGATQLLAVSGNVANAAAAATFAATAGKTNYLTGVEILAGGATSAALVAATITGLLGGTITYPFAAPAGATSAAVPLIVTFNPPLPASAANIAITATLPALGAGNTMATVTLHGYRL